MVELAGLRSAAEVCAIGDEAYVRKRLQAFADAGTSDLLAAPYTPGPDREAAWQRTLDCLASLA